MIDLHSHLLPAIDDGAKTIDDTLALAHKAVEEGIEYSVVTPHHFNGKYNNYAGDIRVLTDKVQKAINQAKIPLTVYPGQEVRIHESLINSIGQGHIQFLDLNQKYLLLEFPTQFIPDYSENVVFDLLDRGITPIIAHPERNHEIQEDPNILLRLVDMGALGQLTCASYVGHFDKKTTQISEQMLEANLVHILSSDAHDLGFRTFFYKESFKKLKKYNGQDKVDQFINNAKAVINGEDFVREQPTPINQFNENKGFWSWFKK